jgi:hypothetical protein
MSNGATCRTVIAAAGLVLMAMPGRTQVPLQYHAVTPCRLADTRNVTPPVLSSLVTRTFQVQGLCGIPPGAKAVSINLTVVRPNGPGHLTVFPTGIAVPLVSSLNFVANEPAIANGAIVPVADQSVHPQDLAVQAFVSATNGNVHFVLDVTGYFQ